MPPTVWESVVLGAIRGLAEILPISGSGHLALTGMLFGAAKPALAAEVLLRSGLLLATLLVLWPRVRAALSGGLAALANPSLFSTSPGARDALVVLLAGVPSALLSFALRRVVERFDESPLAIGFGFLVTGLVLVGSRFAKPGSDEQPGVVGALLTGAVQGVAVLPGLSSTASTLTLLLLFGVRRERAFELALLVSLPASLGGLVLAVVSSPPASPIPGWAGPAAAAGLAAFLAGVAALLLLRRSVAAGQLSWFAAWLVPVSLATLALAKAWPHG